ncbi:MAG: CRTAC1 family protein [Verrucomicrobiota bacterium]
MPVAEVTTPASTTGMVTEPTTIQVGEASEVDVTVESRLQRLLFETSLTSPYATLSVFSGDKELANHIDIPRRARTSHEVLVRFDQPGAHTLRFLARSADVTLLSAKLEPATAETVSFRDNSVNVGLITEKTYKYGGPSVADFGHDGDYDFVLNNHNFIPPQLVENEGGKQVTIKRLYPGPLDYHGTAFGDYDGDGDLDLMVGFGGGSGSNPTSYQLLKNDNGEFRNVTDEVGISIPTRGRSPRWLDLDGDDDLDLALFNAKRPNYDGAQHVFFRNNREKGSFELVDIAGLGNSQGERVVLHDFNQDGRTDVLLYFPLSLWRNDGDFKFTDVTDMLPDSAQRLSGVVGAAAVDVNADGLQEIYLARGRTAYQLSRKSIDFNPVSRRVDIRDDGEKGSTRLDFTAKDAIRFSDMELTYRLYDGGFVLFLGAEKKRKVVNALGFQDQQRPKEMRTAPEAIDITAADAAGWPETREVNGLYIGHLGGDQWRAEWVRDGNIYWQISFSLSGVDDIEYDWTPNNRNVADILLLNQGDQYVDASKAWNVPQGGNHAGVTHGDFNNDGWTDLFVYRYGFLKERVNDLLLLNTGKGSFDVITQHGARVVADPGHGDMGQAFDFDLDGRVDLLSGSEDQGRWYLFKNQTKKVGNHVTVDVGYSPKEKIDAYFATVTVTTESGKRFVRQVGSAGAIHSQSKLSIVHFGLGEETKLKEIEVVWRNGEKKRFEDVPANAIYPTSR